jgi:hypothetical protein
MHHSTTPYWIFVVIPLAMWGIGLLIAYSRRGSVRSATLGSRRLEIHTPADPNSAFERIRAIGGRFKVDDADPSARILVLSTNPSFATWGFFYPVFIHPAGNGSRIEIGIHSRFIQIGPLVTRAHTQCQEQIELLLAPPVARTA